VPGAVSLPGGAVLGQAADGKLNLVQLDIAGEVLDHEISGQSPRFSEIETRHRPVLYAGFSGHIEGAEVTQRQPIQINVFLETGCWVRITDGIG